MIEIKNLAKTYKIDSQEFKALDGIDLQISRGEFVIILGQSGCGKSTLLNILGGMDRPTSGTISVSGKDLSKLSPDQLAKFRQHSIGMIFQKFNLINDASVLENVMMPLKFAGFGEGQQRATAKSVLTSVGLGDRLKSTPKKLSGGQQQRVAIARALVNKPEILLCDEPTGNLDSKTGKEIIDLLRELNQKGQTVIMVTHNQDYAAFADRVVRMLDGKIISNDFNKIKQHPEEEARTKKSKVINYFSKISIALKNLKRRKLRFFLTAFGVSIGAMAIVVLVSFGAGLQKDVQDQVKSYSQVEEINVSGQKTKEMDFSVGPDFAKQESKPLNDQTITEFTQIAGVRAAYPSIQISGEMMNGKLSKMYGETSTPVDLVKQETKDKVKFGHYLQSDEENSVVIPYGQAIALGFDDPSAAIGKEVTIKTSNGKKEYKVNIVGVLAEDDKMVFATLIPYKTGAKWLKEVKADEITGENPEIYSTIVVRANDAGNVPSVKKALDDKGYGTHSYEDIAKQMSRTFAIMQIVLGVVGGIALLVASLGIVNTMLMSILERTKEIGIMKAVGARGKDIRSIFLIEASMIGLFGGLVGLGLGYLGSGLAGMIVNNYLLSKSASGNSISFYIPLYLSLGVVVFSVLVAALAGYLPSRRAAKLDPAVALRED